jgi:hypothetical protein
MDVAALPQRLRQELETFAVAAVVLEGKDLRVVGWGDADAAIKTIQRTLSTGVASR